MGFAEEIYALLKAKGAEVILDDRDERAGIKFKDSDLIGFPYQVIVSDRHIKMRKIEIKERQTGSRTVIPSDDILAHLKLC
jgi:prolyl-tRNA synthetase